MGAILRTFDGLTETVAGSECRNYNLSHSSTKRRVWDRKPSAEPPNVELLNEFTVFSVILVNINTEKSSKNKLFFL